MHSELVYRIGLTMVPHIGPVQAKVLVEKFGSAAGIFNAGIHSLEQTQGMGTWRARQIKYFNQFNLAEQEAAKIQQFRIGTLFLTDSDYPARLLHCYDPPTLLYYRGKANLNHAKVIAVIGTRSNSAYGQWLTEELIKGLAPHQPLIVSGLAYGIDAIAHRQAISMPLPTVAVLAHGLDQLYPPGHRGLARDMISGDGGLLTEFRLGVKPDKHHFPNRNRLVAGMCDAVVVVESGRKGGSMVTAELANDYHRDVFAFPGRTNDTRSAGCLYLIRQNKASLISCADDLVQQLGWNTPVAQSPAIQRSLFANLNDDERQLSRVFDGDKSLHRDEMNTRSGLAGSRLAAAILSLEMKGLLRSLPGNLYCLEP